MLFPSENAAMGGVSIALVDRLGDPFYNPARAADVPNSFLTTNPYYYSIRSTRGPQGYTTRTLPLSAVVRHGRYFAGMTVAWQEMARRVVNICCAFLTDPTSSFVSVVPQEGSLLTRNNLYLTVLGGAELGGGLSFGASLFRGSLNGIEGVQLLYSQGDNVDQDGRMAVYKAGLHQRWPSGRTAEVVLQHHRFRMAHAMTAVIWTAGDSEEDQWQWQTEERLEKDETNGVALRVGMTQPLGSGWTLGTRLVGDWKTHPKIPNYDLMQIPRDPGNTGAYNVGIGFSRKRGHTTLAFELIYEPIWSHTWANAEENIVVDGQPTGILAGDMTVENFFRFNNGFFRMGVKQAGRRLSFGMGLDLHMIRYRLEQENFVERSQRVLNESWGEWTLSTGVGWDFTSWRLQYLSLLTWGTGQPGLAQRGVGMAERFSANASFVVAPAGALDLIDARVWTHRLSIVVPFTE